MKSFSQLHKGAGYGVGTPDFQQRQTVAGYNAPPPGAPPNQPAGPIQPAAAIVPSNAIQFSAKKISAINLNLNSAGGLTFNQSGTFFKFNYASTSTAIVTIQFNYG